jgi:acetyl/propionyl-CoA carboxylase alpha subunit
MSQVEQRALPHRGVVDRPPWKAPGSAERDLVQPAGSYLGVREVLEVLLGLEPGKLSDFASLPLGKAGARLLATRYFIENADIWLAHFVWEPRLAARSSGTGRDLVAEVRALHARVRVLREGPLEGVDVEALLGPSSSLLEDPLSPSTLATLVALARSDEDRASLRARLRERAGELLLERPELLDRAYLAALELSTQPATTVAAGTLRYVLVADKGEMGVRAVRETVALGLVPVVLHSLTDDAAALQVRLAREHGGFAIGLAGSFRESYASYAQIADRVNTAFRERFGDAHEHELARAALYPGYGPLAENSAAIRHFRQRGITFVGPMQDVVERVGDKRRFRAVVERIAPDAVTPGIVIAESDAARIRTLVMEGYEAGAFRFPGRLKAANGGGGRGQAIVASVEALDGAIGKVLGEIESYGWEAGVMFEQNIPETIHLEVQVLRDRYGNARHFGMRDCTEQRASQKIQEEAPPALLQRAPELRERIEETAVAIADRVGYVGAGTVELMYQGGRVYFLEMNTRIQVEHPVTEESHAIRRGDVLEPLNLVQWQLRLANGAPIDFAQDDVVQTHVAREFRINAESWHAGLKDARDGKRGLFVPNAGVFDRIEVPDAQAVRGALADVDGLEDLKIRFDCGFEAGDVLVNKDPTFGKLIVAVRATRSDDAYELLRRASLAVLERFRIEGRQVRPDGRVIPRSRFQTNVAEHRWILEHDIVRRHGRGDAVGRHVNWVVEALRQAAAEG